MPRKCSHAPQLQDHGYSHTTSLMYYQSKLPRTIYITSKERKYLEPLILTRKKKEKQPRHLSFPADDGCGGRACGCHRHQSPTGVLPHHLLGGRRNCRRRREPEGGPGPASRQGEVPWPGSAWDVLFSYPS